METVPPGIATFVSVRLSGPTGPSVASAFARRAKQNCGVILTPPEDLAFVASFGLVSNAVAFARLVQEIVSRDDLAAQTGTLPAIGIECGEVQPGANLKRLVPFDRSCELAQLAYDGQNLLGPGAREVVRPILPAGFGIIHLGETRLGTSISADRICQLTISGFQVDFPRIEALDEVSTNILDVPADFIGRDREAKEVRRALMQSRLVSIVGPAGVGKSALAYWLAFDLVESYRDGAWKVDLAKIPRGGSVATAIAADLRLPSMSNHSNEDRVLISLSTMEGVIWLDNCEHVLQQAQELLPKILKYCGAVTLLVTSRTALRIEGESVFDLDPFSTPTDPDEYLESEPVRLFLNRAHKADPEFSASPKDLELIVEICRRVDGLPLAIELAAAQIGKLSLGILFSRLAEALQKATAKVASRHKTIEGALQWSYSLLNDKEQTFFRTLGTLAGPTNIDLVLAVGSSPKASPEASRAILDTLVSASLVQEVKAGTRGSYRLLEPIRQFALDQLRKKEEERAANNKFGRAFVSWLLSLKEAKVPPKRWQALIARERANLERALQCLLEDPRGGASALQICVELYDYWILQGPYDQAHRWYEQSLRRCKRLPNVDTADIYNWMGLFAGYAGRYEECKAAFRQAIEMHRKNGNRERQATALSNLALHMRNCGELEESIEVYEEAIRITDKGSPGLVTRVANIASHLEQLGRVEEAQKYHDEAWALNEVFDNPWTRATLESQAVAFDLRNNNTRSAEVNLARCLASYREVGNMQGLIGTIETAGFLALRLGNVERAAKLIGGSEKLFIQHGVGRPPVDEEKKKQAVSEIIDALGSERAETLFVVGALMTVDVLYDFARAGVGVFEQITNE